MLERSPTRFEMFAAQAAACAMFLFGVPTHAHALGREHLASQSRTDSASPDPAKASTSSRKWITHRIVPRETLDEIGKRYGVSANEITAWNKKSIQSGLKAGRTLRINARVVPPPREKITYVVQFGDTWAEIATKYNVELGDLRAWNTKVPKQFRSGQKITVYTNPRPRAVTQIAQANDPNVGQPMVPSLPVFDVPAGGVSIGKPTRGRLVNAVQLPESDLYDVRRPDEAWGSSHTVLQVQTAIASFRQQAGYDGKIIIGAISERNGGRFRPHRSHQSGRDVDIRLPKKRGADLKSDNPADIDWEMSWKMIDAFIDTGEIEYIFLDYSRQKRLYDAARRLGVPSSELAKAIQYPRSRKTNNGIVRHAEGHLVHVHVRVECPDDQARCETDR